MRLFLTAAVFFLVGCGSVEQAKVDIPREIQAACPDYTDDQIATSLADLEEKSLIWSRRDAIIRARFGCFGAYHDDDEAYDDCLTCQMSFVDEVWPISGDLNESR